MKFINTRSGLIAFATIASALAQASEPGWYIGGNLGQSRATFDSEEIFGALSGQGFTGTSYSEDERDAGYKLFGGYQFNRYFALEGGYFDLGEFDFNAHTTPPGTLDGSLELNGINFDAVGILPFTEKFSAFGRIGVNYAKAKASIDGTGAVSTLDPNSSEYGTNYKLGVGIEYAFTRSVAMRVEAERYRIDDSLDAKGDVDLFSVGVLYRFGQQQTAHVAQAAPAEPVAAATPLPPPVKVAFSADSLFDFNKFDVKPAGKKSLDALAADLKSANFDIITVVGHTDRIGSHEDNQILSQRRAEAVKAYLVQSAGIPADKIVARGMGDSEPLTKSGECTGEKATQKLITCLQPDRRGEIEVIAVKK
jgi:OOP family OmpA-OmpF porin